MVVVVGSVGRRRQSPDRSHPQRGLVLTGLGLGASEQLAICLATVTLMDSVWTLGLEKEAVQHGMAWHGMVSTYVPSSMRFWQARGMRVWTFPAGFRSVGDDVAVAPRRWAPDSPRG